MNISSHARKFTIMFFIFFAIRYYLSKYLTNSETVLYDGIIQSMCYALAFNVSAILL